MQNIKSFLVNLIVWTVVAAAGINLAVAFANTAAAAPTSEAPTAELAADTTYEGQDVLVLDYDAGVPDALWNAALAAGYVGDPNDGCECLYIPVGTTLDVPGGLALATADGWMGCVDFVTGVGECSAAGPVQPLPGAWAAGVIARDGGEQSSAVSAVAARFKLSKAKRHRVTEDSAGWSCAVNGNHVCGPGNRQGAAPGCYRDGKLVVPWTRFDNPRLDPLWAQMTPPC